MDKLLKIVYAGLLCVLVVACSYAKPIAQPIKVMDGFGGSYGYLDQNLEVLIPPQYYSATNFDGGIAVVKYEDEGDYYIIDRAGNHIAQFEARYMGKPSDGMIWIQRPDGELIYCDYKGRIQLEGYSFAENFSEGKAFVEIEGEGTYIDKNGNILFPWLEIEEGEEFQNGLAIVKIKREDGSEDRYGMIDKRGYYEIEPKYSLLLPFSEGLAPAEFGEKKGYINKDEEVVIEPQYHLAYTFHKGFAFVSQWESLRGIPPSHFKIIDREGYVVKELDPEIMVVSQIQGGLRAIGINEEGSFKIGFMDYEGNIVIEPMFDSDKYNYSHGYWVTLLSKNGELKTVLINAENAEMTFLEDILRENE